MSIQLNSVLEVLLGADNERRIEAERYLQQLTVQHFDKGIDALVHSMSHQNSQVQVALKQVSTMAAVLLKQKYLDNSENFSKISAEKLEFIVNSTKNNILPEKQFLFLKRCCEILVRVYTHIVTDFNDNFQKQQRQLIQVITSLSSVDALNIKLVLMYTIEIVCESSFDDNLLMEYSAGFVSIFQKGLQDLNVKVKVSAFKTLTIFLSSIEKLEFVMKFSQVLNMLLEKAIELIKFDQDSGILTLESLNELMDHHPKFIKPILTEMLSIYVEIMEAQALLVNLRITAMHGVLLLVTGHPVAVKKNKVFKTKYINVYMKMLSEIHETSIEEWATEFKDEIISKNDISLSTEEHLAQIHQILGNKFMMPLFTQTIQECLRSDQPNFQHAGLTALSILTENCHESFKGQLKNIFSLIFPLLDTTNPRLIADIVVAMGYMSEQFAPEIQENYGELILQFICKCLCHQYPKVQYKGAQCIQNFVMGIAAHKDRNIKVMDKFIDQILENLGKIFEGSLSSMNYLMLEAVLDTISTIAQNNPFDRFYPTFMPGLKKIIQMINADTQQKVMVRSKTIQTMGYLLYSIRENSAMFNPECQQIMSSLMQMQETLPEDDMMHKSFFVVYENVVECLKENFTQYSDKVFEYAYLAASRKVLCQILNENQVSKKEPNKCMNRIMKFKLDLKIDGIKNVVFNTDHLTQKVEATVLLASMAEFMGKNYVSYIEKTVPLITELLVYKHSRQVRNNSIEIIKFMILNCPQPEQKMEVLKMIWSPFLNELATVVRGQDHIQTCSMVEVLAQTMPFMNQQMLAKLPQVMTRVISMVNTLVKGVEADYKMEEMDEADEEQLADDTADIEQVLGHVETIIKIGKDQPAYENLRKLFPSDFQWNQEA